MRLLVVGASGFLGRNLLLAAPRDWDIHATYRAAESFPAWLAGARLDHVIPVRVDLRDEAAVGKAVGKLQADACLFLAADTRVRILVEDPPLDVHNNIAPVANVIKHHRGGRFVFVSSGAVYMGHEGLVSPHTALDPSIPYAISKYAAELYVRSAANRSWFDGSVVLRFFGAYGPFEPARKITTKLVQSARAQEKEFTIFGDGGNLIDVMCVDDAVLGLLAAIRGPANNVTVDFCAGSPSTLNEFASAVGLIFRHSFELRHEGESPEYIRFHASPEGMAAAFGVRPQVRLEEGMRRLAAWLGSPEAPR